ncbi:MAG: outer membrane lipoprotein carrier protein LolA [Spirochaetaceae bacterium]|nr:outer membrane lipoprotein carrier protein LolA [Spirochaetaceae bacterium]
MKKIFLILAFFVSVSLYAQQITTASVFFSSMSEQYAKITDYTASIKIIQGNSTSVGTVRFKAPELLRMDFSVPAEQTIVFTGSELMVYLPSNRTTLVQTVDGGGLSSNNIASAQGLLLMQRSYTIAYESGPEPIPLEDGSSEMVIALSLNRRNANETFRRIRLLVSPDTKLIRRVEAWPVSGNKITFDFTNYTINGGIADTAFVYTPPAGEVINNFLYME